MSDRSIGNPKVGAQHYNQPLGNEGLVVKTTEQLVARQPWKGAMKARGEDVGTRVREKRTGDIAA